MPGPRLEITDLDTPEPWHPPSPRLRTMRRAEVAVVSLAVAILAAVLSGDRAGAAALAGALAGTLVLALLAQGYVGRRYRSWGYAERADDLIIRRGVLIKRLTVVPYGRMQFVDVTAGLVERLFGIATVRLHTAAAATDARLPGLEVAEAGRLRELLTSLGEARAAGI